MQRFLWALARVVATLALALALFAPSVGWAAGAASHVPPERLGAVAFPDRQHGWAAGAGVILATADGGRTWRRQYRGTQTISQLDLLDATTGWALGDRALLRTSDGGRHWQPVGSRLPAFRQVDFVSARSGWGIADGTLFATADGGASWRRQPTPGAAGDVCFADAQDGWLANAGAFSAHPAPTTLLRTDDGGRSWRAVPLPGVADAGSSNGGWFQMLRCPAAAVLWDLVVTGAYAGGEGYALYRTADAGRHWTAVAGNPFTADGRHAARGPGPVAKALAVPNASTAYLLAGCGACQGDGTTTIGGTADGGRTWRNHPPVPGLPWSTGGLAFADATHGWLAAQWSAGPGLVQSGILATADGGATWSPQYATATSMPAGQASPATPCRYTLGFAALHAALPVVVGACLQNAHPNPGIGGAVALQPTANGLLIWQQAGNRTAFSDGRHTWVATASGLHAYANPPSLRFVWLSPPPPTTACRFTGGFAVFSALLPGLIGQCLDNERDNPADAMHPNAPSQRDGIQHTTRGLLAYRFRDQHTAFTDGERTLVLGPCGMEVRPNSRRFPWERNAARLPVVPDAYLDELAQLPTPAPPAASSLASPRCTMPSWTLWATAWKMSSTTPPTATECSTPRTACSSGGRPTISPPSPTATAPG